MSEFPLLTYLRLKFFVLLLRLSSKLQAGSLVARDRLLTQRRYPTVQPQRLSIPSREHGRCIAADLYLPPPPLPSNSSSSTTTTTEAKPRLFPVLVNYHGSGFVIDFLGSNVLLCTQLASELGIAVLDADYRKAPEHPFPAALHDVEDLLRWLGGRPTLSLSSSSSFFQYSIEEGAAVSLDPSRVVLSGYSAGGTLALIASSTTLQQNKNSDKESNQLMVGAGVGGDDGVKVRGVVGIYPLLDLSTSPAARDGKGWSPSAILLNLFIDCYLPNKQDRFKASVSPSARAIQEEGALDRFPDVVGIVTCEKDILASEGRHLVKVLRQGAREEEEEEEGGDGTGGMERKKTKRTVVRSIHLEGVNHVFDAGAELGTLAWDRREEMHAMVVGTVRQALEL